MVNFLSGVIVGSIVFDLVWRVSMHFSNKLIEAQREHIAALHERFGLEP